MTWSMLDWSKALKRLATVAIVICAGFALPGGVGADEGIRGRLLRVRAGPSYSFYDSRYAQDICLFGSCAELAFDLEIEGLGSAIGVEMAFPIENDLFWQLEIRRPS